MFPFATVAFRPTNLVSVILIEIWKTFVTTVTAMKGLPGYLGILRFAMKMILAKPMRTSNFAISVTSIPLTPPLLPNALETMMISSISCHSPVRKETVCVVKNIA
jgi:hypothetical protein